MSLPVAGFWITGDQARSFTAACLTVIVFLLLLTLKTKRSSVTNWYGPLQWTRTSSTYRPMSCGSTGQCTVTRSFGFVSWRILPNARAGVCEFATTASATDFVNPAAVTSRDDVGAVSWNSRSTFLQLSTKKCPGLVSPDQHMLML